MKLNEEQLDQLLEGCKTTGDVDTQRIVGGGERRLSTQLCIVHLVRASPRYVAYKDSKAVIAALKDIYQSATIDRRSARWK
jgi:hypothetical protein